VATFDTLDGIVPPAGPYLQNKTVIFIPKRAMATDL